jgi:hypothetical protein
MLEACEFPGNIPFKDNLTGKASIPKNIHNHTEINDSILQFCIIMITSCWPAARIESIIGLFVHLNVFLTCQKILLSLSVGGVEKA